MNFVIDPPNPGATSATITAGQTAIYNLALQSIDGFAGPVTLTCTGAPAGATCSVIPTPVALAANATAPFQVQVTTTARTGSANRVSPQTPQHTISLPAARAITPRQWTPWPPAKPTWTETILHEVRLRIAGANGRGDDLARWCTCRIFACRLWGDWRLVCVHGLVGVVGGSDLAETLGGLGAMRLVALGL